MCYLWIISNTSQRRNKRERNSKKFLPALTELKFIVEDIKDDNPMQDQRNNDLIINLEGVSCITPTKDHHSKGVEDKDTELISTNDIDGDNVNHKTQKVEEEQGHGNIEDCDPMDMIIISHSEKSTASSEKNYIIRKASKEEPIVEVPHIDFIFGNRRWKLENCT